MASIDGLGSGLDTTSIIQQLLQVERQPQTRLAIKRTTALAAGAEWGKLATSLGALLTATKALGAPGALSKVAVSSSDAAAVTATTSASAAPGVHTVRVVALATAQQLTSRGSFTSASSVVGAGSLVLHRGDSLATLGATGIGVDSTVPLGVDHSVSVTQASAAAIVTGAAQTISDTQPVTIKAATSDADGNDTIDFTVNGTRYTATIAAGTYTSHAQLAGAAQKALDTATGAGVVRVSVTAAGEFSFATAREGSEAGVTVNTSPTVAGGIQGLTSRATSANGVLGLTSGTQAAGQDALVTVDGVEHRLTRVDGSDVNVGGIVLRGVRHLATGSLVATAAARLGSTTATAGDLVTAVNASGSPFRAALVDDGAGGFRLSLTDSRTGAGTTSSVSTDLTGFGDGFDGRAGTNAEVVVDGVTHRPASNRTSDLIAGWTIDLKAATGADVTLTGVRDEAAIGKVGKGFVDALNAALRQMKTATAYDVTTKRGGALVGDFGARSLAHRLVDTVSDAGRFSTSGVTLSELGITLQRDGTYAFDQAKFDAAVADKPGAATLVTELTTKLGQVLTGATASDGVLARGKESSETQAKRLQDQISRWDQRLELKEARYRKQFTALESALAGLKNQGTWLAGQLGGLPTWDS